MKLNARRLVVGLGIIGSGLAHDGACVRAVRPDGDDGEGDGQKTRHDGDALPRGIVLVKHLRNRGFFDHTKVAIGAPGTGRA